MQLINRNKLTKKGLIITMALACAGAILCIGVSILLSGGFFLPRWIEWESRTFTAGPNPCQIMLSHKSVSILQDNKRIWTSPEGLKVQQALSCDIDNDAEDELILLCWKKGRYGSYKPFWVEEDEKEWSQHIFVYELDSGKAVPKWMSSYLGQDVASMAADEENAPPARLLLTDTDGLISSWVWDFWGFTKENTDVTFAVFGDNLIHESIYRYGLQHGGSFAFLFEGVRELLSESDISVINQETPFTDNPSLYSDFPRFGTPAGVGQAIADAGFDVVTCATNHALDQGAHGIQITKELFEARNILCLGIQTEKEKDSQPCGIIQKNGIRFALFNYTYGTNGIRIPEENPNMVHLLEDEEKIRAELEKARTEADFVIVFAHWGTENAPEADEFQRKWTQIFLESKADVVIGTHPHTLQPYEMLKGSDGHEMLVYYSIGNFISAQPETSCVKGGMAGFTVSPAAAGYKVTEYTLTPLAITRQEDGRYTVKPGEP